uniref:Uncharacterized protein n=1 Tax=Parascaris equorum TaxID=6256 RepID=A0A914S5H6_PAREQ
MAHKCPKSLLLTLPYQHGNEGNTLSLRRKPFTDSLPPSSFNEPHIDNDSSPEAKAQNVALITTDGVRSSSQVQ